MTLYELTQALKKRWLFVVIAGAVVLVLAIFMAFTFSDGKLTWRSGEKWEAAVQIAVVSQGNESLTNAETRSEHIEAAATYSGLIQSNEAAAAIGDANGFVMEEPVASEVERGSSLITATVLAPTEEQATGAALSVFDYLLIQLDQPLTPSGVGSDEEAIEVVEITGPFDSVMTLDLDAELSEVDQGLFVRVDSEVGSSLVVPVARSAGEAVTVETTLAPLMTLLLTLQDSGGSVLDSVRLAPPVASGFTAVYPALEVSLDEAAIFSGTDEDGDPEWNLDEGEVSVAWVSGSAVGESETSSVVPVDIALVTEEPAAVQIGGRRGPILLGVILLLGTVLIVTSVIVAESWAKDKESAEGGGDRYIRVVPEDLTQGGKPKPPPVADTGSVPPGSIVDEIEKPADKSVSGLSQWEALGVDGDTS